MNGATEFANPIRRDNGYFDNDYQNYRLSEVFAFLITCVYNKPINVVVNSMEVIFYENRTDPTGVGSIQNRLH